MAVFDYVVARSIQEGLELIADSAVATLPIAGGTDLLPLLKDGVTAAERLVAIDAIPGMDAITQVEEGLTIGAAATIADVASHPVIRSGYPVLAPSGDWPGHAANPDRGDHRRESEPAASLLVLPQPLNPRA